MGSVHSSRSMRYALALFNSPMSQIWLICRAARDHSGTAAGSASSAARGRGPRTALGHRELAHRLNGRLRRAHVWRDRRRQRCERGRHRSPLRILRGDVYVSLLPRVAACPLSLV